MVAVSGQFEARRRAVGVARAAIVTTRAFPKNVFASLWARFWFFDPDMLFKPQFVETARRLLASEDGACVCVCSLDDEAPAVFSIEQDTSAGEYQEWLLGSGPADGVLYTKGRFACASDTGTWCIYCERNTELAVLTSKNADASLQIRSVIRELGALPIVEALKTPPAYALVSRPSTEPFRQKLLQEYP